MCRAALGGYARRAGLVGMASHAAPGRSCAAWPVPWAVGALLARAVLLRQLLASLLIVASYVAVWLCSCA